MSCATCSSGSARYSPPPTELSQAKPVLLSVETVPDIENLSFPSVTGSKLVYPMTLVSQRPVTGWAGAFTVNGVDVSVNSSTPEGAIQALVSIANGNGLKMTNKEAWLWLNYSWMNISPYKRHKTDFVQVSNALLKGGVVSGSLQVTARTWVEDYTPAKWGSIAWKWLGFLLVDEKASLTVFSETLHRLLDSMNPEISPLTGCEQCYTHFKEVLDKAPEFQDVQSARHWLWGFHNSVNVRLRKPVLTWVKACQENMWAYSFDKNTINKSSS
jgi:hypothetical protein